MMDGLMVDILKAVIGGLVTGAAAWGAIKVHVWWVIRRLDDVQKCADHAHRRIDDILKTRS